MKGNFEKWHMDNNPNYMPISDAHLNFITSYCEYIYPIVMQYLTEDFMKEVFDKKGKMLNGRGKLTDAYLWIYNPITPDDSDSLVGISINPYIYANEEDGRCQFKSRTGESCDSSDKLIIATETLDSYNDFSRVLVHELAHLIDKFIIDALLFDTALNINCMLSEVVAFYIQGKFRSKLNDDKRDNFYRIYKKIYEDYPDMACFTLQDLSNQISEVMEVMPKFITE